MAVILKSSSCSETREQKRGGTDDNRCDYSNDKEKEWRGLQSGLQTLKQLKYGIFTNGQKIDD